jgi:hypothetical protein
MRAAKKKSSDSRGTFISGSKVHIGVRIFTAAITTVSFLKSVHVCESYLVALKLWSRR